MSDVSSVRASLVMADASEGMAILTVMILTTVMIMTMLMMRVDVRVIKCAYLHIDRVAVVRVGEVVESLSLILLLVIQTT
jgi:hypothetical protein